LHDRLNSTYIIIWLKFCLAILTAIEANHNTQTADWNTKRKVTTPMLFDAIKTQFWCLTQCFGGNDCNSATLNAPSSGNSRWRQQIRHVKKTLVFQVVDMIATSFNSFIHFLRSSNTVQQVYKLSDVCVSCKSKMAGIGRHKPTIDSKNVLFNLCA